MQFLTIDSKNIGEICDRLAGQDEALARILHQHGTPPVWEREASFSTLIHIILEQQVSLASALSAFNKLREKVVTITPQTVLALSDDDFKACYFSRQKTVYARALASAILNETLDFRSLHELDDEDVRAELTKIKGIGDWTADIFLLMALRRADVMPKGDLALHLAYKKLHALEKPPKSDEFLEITRCWSPFRAVAARMLWHYYLAEREAAVGRPRK